MFGNVDIYYMYVAQSVTQTQGSATYLFLCLFVLLFKLDYLSFAATHKLLDMFGVLFTEFTFPKALPTIRKETEFTSLTKDMTIYATCPKCYTTYLFETSFGLYSPEPPRFCTYVDSLKSTICQTAIYKNNSNIPMKKFVYHCLVSSIQKLYLREGFEEKCEEWRS